MILWLKWKVHHLVVDMKVLSRSFNGEIVTMVERSNSRGCFIFVGLTGGRSRYETITIPGGSRGKYWEVFVKWLEFSTVRVNCEVRVLREADVDHQT